MNKDPLFELREVSKEFRRRGTAGHASGISFAAIRRCNLLLEAGAYHAVVGESGSGKTTLARLLCGLTAPTSGQILYQGTLLQQCLRRERHAFRTSVQLILQNPFNSLNSKWRVRSIIEEGVRPLPRSERETRVSESLENVGLSQNYLRRHPTELSGGERQRVAIARALAMHPACLILDEPTSALDVSIQAGILNLLTRLRSQLSLGLILITHDLSVAAQLAENLVVLRSGEIVESGPCDRLLNEANHPYTRELVNAARALSLN